MILKVKNRKLKGIIESESVLFKIRERKGGRAKKCTDCVAEWCLYERIVLKVVNIQYFLIFWINSYKIKWYKL